eukprot:Seg725.5 transcript_id=Seg725.5/GoldUCD/mRNA.D3Y31 product="Nicotinate phosphoribosyltransferase" protein_id=Seg725.5/GoldUCD/D3Y31
MASSYSSEPQNGIVQALLTDLYQISMAYSYWESGKTHERAVFDLFFRTSPFQGEFTIFAGLQECISFLQKLKFTESDIEYLQSILPKTCRREFFDYLRHLSASEITLYAIPEGTVVFPRVPLLRVEGPLPVAQLVETSLLNLVNYASLVATNAARFRIAAGDEKKLLEFGLRRAQGPDGALSASKYCYIGGFDGTSNVLAGKKFGIPCKGTQAHAFVSSFLDSDEKRVGKLKQNGGTGEERDILPVAQEWLKKVAKILEVPEDQTSRSELIAFCAFAVAFPTNFLALVDTYNVMRSGLPNFCAVALTLNDFGYKAVGVRLDSGDLSYLSKRVRAEFAEVAMKTGIDWFKKLVIVASNDLNEETLYSLEQQGHEIDSFGIGTHLVTCQKQPALGCVYKLVEINEEARMKISEEVKKVSIPGRKNAFRLYGTDGKALVDLVQKVDEPDPQPNARAMCRDPILESKRAHVKPARVEPLLKLFFQDGKVSPLSAVQGFLPESIIQKVMVVPEIFP